MFFIFFCVSLFFFVLVFLVFKRRNKSNTFTEHFKKLGKEKPLKRTHKEEEKCIRVTLKEYLKNRPKNEHFDAIVIGSGASGMTCSSTLAQHGKKVLLLEQHDHLGGYTHSFEEEGYEFDSGLHYMGGLEEGSIFNNLFKYVTGGRIKFEISKANVDKVTVGKDKAKQKVYLLPGKSLDALRSKLIEYFPKEEKGLTIFFDMVDEVFEVSSYFFILKMVPFFLVKFLLLFGKGKKYKKFANMTVKHVIDNIAQIKDTHLKNLLARETGYYGCSYENAPMLIHSIVMKNMGEKYFPIGGTSQVAKQIIPTITTNGGICLSSAPVSKIIIKNNKAIGVRMGDSDKTEFYGSKIISSAGLHNSLVKFLPSKYSKNYKIEISKFQHSIQYLFIFIGFNKPLNELNLPSENIIYYEQLEDNPEIINQKYDALKGPRFKGFEELIGFASIFHSVRDPNWQKRFPNKSACTILSKSFHKYFEKFETQKIKQRGNEYNEIKDMMSKAIMERFLMLYPELEEHIDYFNIGTPLSANHYGKWEKGTGYGYQMTKEQMFSPITRIETKIDNYLLTGQEILMMGVSGAMLSGLCTASKILKKNLIGELGEISTPAK